LGADDATGALRLSRLPGSAGASPARLVLAAHGTSSRLAWRIDPPLDRGAVTNPVFLVDAHDGEIWIERERVKTADVRAFEHNPVASPEAANFALIELDPGATELRGPLFLAKSAVPSGHEHAAIADANGDFLFPEPDVTNPADNVQPDDPFAEVQMYFHAERFHAWLVEHGFPGLECHSDGETATLIANEREIGSDPADWQPFDNAYYSGDCDATMVFGQGTDVDFAYDGDVVAHEYGHGVVSKMTTNGLGGVRLRDDGRLTDAGGLNEAVADFLSATFHGDPRMGEYVSEYWSVLGGGELRNLDNDYRCPHDMVGEVHLDAVPVGGMLWEMYGVLGEALVPVVLDSLSMLPRDASVEEFAAALSAVASVALSNADAQQISDIAAARGMDDCLRVAPLEPERRPLFVRATGSSYLPFAPPPLQFELEAPADADTLRLTFEASYGVTSVTIADGDVIPGVVVKRGSRIEFVYSGQEPIEVEMGTQEFYLDLDGSVDIPAAEGEVLYLAFVNTGEDRLRLDDIEAEWILGGDGDGDGDGDDDATQGESDGGEEGEAGTGGGESTGDEGSDDPGAQSESGCACAASSRERGSLGLLWPLLLVPLRPGRRRHR
jgi:hypothetical protein